MSVLALGTSPDPTRLEYVYRVSEVRLMRVVLDNHLESGEIIQSVAFAVSGSKLTAGEDFGPVAVTDTTTGLSYTYGYGVLLTAVTAGLEIVVVTVTIDNPNTTAHRVIKPKIEIEIAA